MGKEYCYIVINGMTLKDILFPKFCLGCGAVGSYICYSCSKKIEPFERRVCLFCDKASLNGLTHDRCLQRLNVDGIVSIFKYNPMMWKIVKNIKYRLAREIFEELVKNIKPQYMEMIIKMKRIFSKALIQPIPLTRKRINARGFNQAVLVSEFLSSVLGLETADYLIRKKDGTPQAELVSRLERYQNIRGVFSLRPGSRIEDKNIILVDDVITSGATINEAARVLKKAGAGKVYAISLARG